MPSLVPGGTPEGQIAAYNNIALAAFLLGGAVGGIGLGMRTDRIGRTPPRTVTNLLY
jgi:hypothetical protein